MLRNLLDNELINKPLSDIIIHLKTENLVKDEPITDWKEQQARIILWHRYAVSALFGPIFNEAKRRLKLLLNNKIIYADGLRPDQLAMLTNQIKCKYFFSNDLSK